MIYRRLISILVAGICLLVMEACRDYDGYMDIVTDEVPAGSQDSYVNFTFTVSTGKTPGSVTRADEKPLGGENGDGREAGFERENAVTGVTIVFYQNPDGINATASSTPSVAVTKVKLVKYYPVTLVASVPQGTEYPEKQDEAIYTTGEQKIDAADGFDFTGKYRVLVIANADLTSGTDRISAGDDLSVVRDKVISSALYTGTGLRSDANTFLMTSENDIELDFAGAGVKTVVKTGSLTKEVYSFTGLRIERMAARIDFSTQYDYYNDPGTWSEQAYGAVYKTKDKSNNNYAFPGYVYPVYKATDFDGKPTSNDRFVLTAIVPFNLSLTNTGCNEYLFKRVLDIPESTPVITYLKDEEPSWVIDPDRESKTSTSTAHPSYFDYNLTTLSATESHTDLVGLGNCMTMESFQSSPANYLLKVSGDNTADNLIIGYPKENTLLPESPLYYYATGIAIEGYYYPGDDATKTPMRCVYVGYLRHHGEGTSYDVEDIKSLDKAKTCKTNQIMNFGVVRNNIYRVTIHKVNERGATIKIKIEEKHWRHVDNPAIYI